jgi:hypothetical protein
MRTDLYTRMILTVIALLLAAIALKPILQPKPAMAQGNLNGVQFSACTDELYAVDTRTGDIWAYKIDNGNVFDHAKIAQLGKPLVH